MRIATDGAGQLYLFWFSMIFAGTAIIISGQFACESDLLLQTLVELAGVAVLGIGIFGFAGHHLCSP